MMEKPSNELENKQVTIQQAQMDMCNGYANGAVGVIVSGVIWLVSASIAHQIAPQKAIWMLFIGGMFIFPISVLISKFMGLSGTHAKGNQLGNLAMEGTIWMVMCLPLALGL
jgi:hypothetical protein